MDPHKYLAFLAIVIVTTLSPGPAVLLAITNGALYGPRRTAVAILGNVSALMLMAGTSALGLGALLLASTALFTALRWLGGLYLVYLGVKIWRSRTLIFDETVARRSALRPNPGLARLYRQAFLVALSNPKAIAFFTALFPLFIAPDRPVIPQFALLALTFACFSFLILMGYAVLSSQARRWHSRPRNGKLFQRLSGGIFIGFGLGLIATQHR